MRTPAAGNLIQPSAEFAANFVPPDYLIDGLIQRRFIYALTAPTGAGKTAVLMCLAAHADLGKSIDGRDVEKGKVLYFAGENPDDIRMRWIKLCDELGLDPASMDVFFLPGTPPIFNEEIRKRIDGEAIRHGPFCLVIVDTSAAYFLGDDENSNPQLGAHARMLRSLVNLPGGPAVIVACHPTKNPNMDNLLPRGGGAFLAEIDGNLVLQKKETSVSLHWHGKYRGLDFSPISFKLQVGTTERLKDSRGRYISSVSAAPITEAEQAGMNDAARSKQDAVLTWFAANTFKSLADTAEKLGWRFSTGAPDKTKVHRTLLALTAEKLVEHKRGRYQLTSVGRNAAKVLARLASNRLSSKATANT